MADAGAKPAPEIELDLGAITAPEVVSTAPDKPSQLELELEERRLHNRDLAQTIDQRKKYAFRVFSLVVLWLIGVFAVLVCQGFAYRGFHLSDNVVLAAIGSTTANIIGILVIIVKYLFSPSNQSHNSN